MTRALEHRAPPAVVDASERRLSAALGRRFDGPEPPPTTRSLDGRKSFTP
jgi:hypothetical protein